jgi:predicted nucleic acid-binding protein
VIVIADTTPLLYLSRIGQLELLRELHQYIVVPVTVWREVVVARPDAAGVDLLRAASWIAVSDQAERTGVDSLVRKRWTRERPLPSLSLGCWALT